MASETHGPRPPDRLAHGGVVRAGCHLLRLTYAGEDLDGTLRVERAADGTTTASGDLYRRGAAPDPGAGVPVFPRADYRYYVRVVEAGGAALGFELHRFDAGAGTWSDAGRVSVRLRPEGAPAGYPGQFLTGDAGGLTIGWLSPHLRRAVIEIVRVAGCDTPLASEAGEDWRGIFAALGWDVRVEESDVDLVEPSGESWSAAELHAALLARRADLDVEWRYRLACVRRLDDDARGLMFDSAGADSNNVPREAAAIAADWAIPAEDPWGLAKGLRFGAARDPYFRTALHEIGHAMGLHHNARGTAIMCPTEEIARQAKPPQQFPQNVAWTYADADARRLRHLPDHWIRPGGVPFGAAFGTAPDLPEPAAAPPLELEVAPLLAAVPLGAPVRVSLVLRNTGGEPVRVPVDLSLRAGHVTGTVTDPAGRTRSFRSVVRSPEPRRLEPLAAGAERTGSLTLLRGAEGPLFPGPGRHAVEVRIAWVVDGAPVEVSGAGTVDVTPAVDADHARAARAVLEAPDALLTLALGGDHLEEGMVALAAALADPRLRPHFAYLEAKRLASRFLARPPDRASAAALLDADTVMSPVEREKAQRLVAEASLAG